MPRPLLTAEIISVGTELTTGSTRDTNAGDLSRDLTDAGVRVLGLTALPDELEAVTRAFTGGLSRADLVVSTGGLGPTPDDLTRESIASAIGEAPAVDPSLEAWLRGLWERRRAPFADANLKQAWLVPSATTIPNERGTAPGWWVDRPDGRIVVALPGPPREMEPMWHGWVLPRLHDRGLGAARAVETLRLAGIGESQLADLLGDLLRSSNPVIATYARPDAVDVRISAVDEPATEGGERGRSASELLVEARTALQARVGRYVWGRDADTWPAVLGDALAREGRRLAVVEVGSAGAVASLLGPTPGLIRATSLTADDPEARQIGRLPDAAGGLFVLGAQVLEASGADVVLAVEASPVGADTSIRVAVVGRAGPFHHERRTVILQGELARGRIAVAAASILRSVLLGEPPPEPR